MSKSAGGMPTHFSAEEKRVAQAEVVERLAQGEPLTQICASPNIPTWTTVWRWARDDEEFQSRLGLARTMAGQHHADKLVELAAKLEAGKVDRDTVAAYRVAADTHKWLSSKLAPRDWGDKSGQQGSGVRVVIVTPLEAEDQAAPNEGGELEAVANLPPGDVND